MINYHPNKEKILKCAEHIISTEGVRGLSIAKIAKECRNSKSTFYNYFTSKNELIKCLQSKTDKNLKLQSTRETIIQKAIAQFSNSAYNGINLETIAKAAGIKRSSIYQYFSSKEELLEAVIYNELKNRKKLVKVIKEKIDDPLIFFEKYIEYFDYYANDRYSIILYATCIYYSQKNVKIKKSFENLRKYTVDAFAESFDIGKSNGVFKKNFNSEIHAKMLFSIMAGINIHSPKDFTDVAKKYLDLIYNEIRIK